MGLRVTALVGEDDEAWDSSILPLCALHFVSLNAWFSVDIIASQKNLEGLSACN